VMGQPAGPGVVPYPATLGTTTAEEGQRSLSGQRSQRAVRAVHTARPWSITRCVNTTRDSGGRRGSRSRSTRSGSSSRVSPRRYAIRLTWVSTTTPSAIPKPTPSTTFAVFRPTPGSSTSSSRVFGTSPPCRSTSACAIPFSDFALFRKKFTWRIVSSISSRGASASACGVGYRAKSPGVTRFTIASVHCAESTVAATSWYASSWSSEQRLSGYASARRSRSRSVRSALAFLLSLRNVRTHLVQSPAVEDRPGLQPGFARHAHPVGHVLQPGGGVRVGVDRDQHPAFGGVADVPPVEVEPVRVGVDLDRHP